MIVLINFYLSSHRFHCENINSYSCSQASYYLNSIAHYREYCIVCKCMYNITSKVTNTQILKVHLEQRILDVEL